MEIVKYKPEYKNDFIRLSKNWITKYFALESDDFEVFENIDKLIKNGAMIYFAIENGVVYATCMAQPMTNDEWEICKLATDERYEVLFLKRVWIMPWKTVPINLQSCQTVF